MANSAPPIPTKALYQHDETLRTHTTRAVAVLPAPSLPDEERLLFKSAYPTDASTAHIVVTSSTIFYAQGGGQPSDTGTMSSTTTPDSHFNVSAVRLAPDGRILHLGHFTPPSTAFSPSEPVSQTIDFSARTLNSRIHTGGHLVGLAVRHLSVSIPNTTELKAQHYPSAAFVEFRGHIDGSHKALIESTARDFVTQALPIEIHWWKPEELADKCAAVPENMVVPPGNDGLVRAVDIVGAGAYPCGGTHVRDTSQVGEIRVRKISRQKGISKVSYQVA